MLQRLDKHIEGLEKLPFNLRVYSLSVLAVIFLRNILEGVLEQKHLIGLHESLVISLIDFFLQNSLFFIALYICLLIIFSSLCRISLDKVIRPLTLYFSIILIVPPIDFLVSKGAGYYLGYPVTLHTAAQVLLNFFNPTVQLKGISVGLRIEVFLACIASMIYVQRKVKGIIRPLAAPFLVYGAVLLNGFYPFICGVVLKLVFLIPGSFNELDSVLRDLFFRGEPLPYAGLRLSVLWVGWIGYLLLILFRIYNRELFHLWLQKILRSHVLIYPLMVLFGLIVSSRVFPVTAAHFLSHPFGIIGSIGVLMGTLLGYSAFFLNIETRQYGSEKNDVNGQPNAALRRVVPFQALISLLLFTIIDISSLFIFFAILSLLHLQWNYPYFLSRRKYFHRLFSGIHGILLFLIGPLLTTGHGTLNLFEPRTLSYFLAMAFLLHVLFDSLFRTRVESERNNIVQLVIVISVLIGTFGSLKLLHNPTLTLTITGSIMVLILGITGIFINKKWVLWMCVLCFFSLGPLQYQWSQSPKLEQNKEKIIQANLFQARKAFEEKRFYQAIEYFEQVLRLSPDIANRHIPFELGMCYLKVRDFKSALAAFSDYLSFHPLSEDAHIGRAIALEKLGFPQKALAIYRMLHDKGYDSPRLSILYGLLLAKLNRFDEAITQYDAISKDELKFSERWLYKGDALTALKRTTEARKAYQTLLEQSDSQRLRRLAKQRLNSLEKSDKK